MRKITVKWPLNTVLRASFMPLIGYGGNITHKLNRLVILLILRTYRGVTNTTLAT